MRQLVVPFLALLLLCAAGCSKDAETAQTPESFLKWSMDRYADLNSLKANCDYTVSYPSDPGQGVSEARTVIYSKPNKFKLVTKVPTAKMEMTSISDGDKLVEFTNHPDMGAQRYSSPSSLAEAKTVQMKHPLFCGSLIFQWLGGSDNYDRLVKSDGGAVEFGGEEKAPNGEQSRIVKFYAQERGIL